jgi:holo-[acyl-carrier-protein] synthase
MELTYPGPVGIGVDIVEIKRVRSIRFLRRFAEYFLTPREIGFFERASDPVEFIASRFAAKEATIKAFPGFLKPHDFEIVKEGKKPVVHFLAPERADGYCALASISHSTDYAVGYAIITEK